MFTLRVVEGPEAEDAHQRQFTTRRLVVGSAPAADLQFVQANQVEAVLDADVDGLMLWQAGISTHVAPGVLSFGRHRVEVQHDPERLPAPFLDEPPSARWRQNGAVSRAWIHDGFGAPLPTTGGFGEIVETRLVVEAGGPKLLFSMPTVRGRNLFLNMDGALRDELWARAAGIAAFTRAERGRVEAPYFPGIPFTDLRTQVELRRRRGSGELPDAARLTLVARAVERLLAANARTPWTGGMISADFVVGWDGIVSLQLAPVGGAHIDAQVLLRGLLESFDPEALVFFGLPLMEVASVTKHRAEKAGSLPPTELAELLRSLFALDHELQMSWLDDAEVLAT